LEEVGKTPGEGFGLGGVRDEGLGKINRRKELLLPRREKKAKMGGGSPGGGGRDGVLKGNGGFLTPTERVSGGKTGGGGEKADERS